MSEVKLIFSESSPLHHVSNLEAALPQKKSCSKAFLCIANEVEIFCTPNERSTKMHFLERIENVDAFKCLQ